MKTESVFDFYRDRIASCPSYGFRAGHEILQVIIRCSEYECKQEHPLLTVEEFNTIISLAEQAHIKMMEDNYNAGWNE